MTESKYSKQMKARIMLSMIIITGLFVAFVFAAAGNLTLDTADGIYNAPNVNSTYMLVLNTLEFGDQGEYIYSDNTSLIMGVDGADRLTVSPLGDVLATSYSIGANTLTTAEWAFLDSQDQSVYTTSAVAFVTVDTGQGANELYDMDQNVLQASAVTFLTVDTGQGANELYAMDQDVQTADDVTFDEITGTNYTIGADTLNSTEFGFLDGQDQSVYTTSAVAFITLNTGQGANELYDMDQNVLQASAVTFAGLTLNGVTDFQGNSVVNVGAAGNDFGATNTLVATSFTSTVDLATNNRFEFRDPQIFIASINNGDLDLTADVHIDLNSPEIRITGNNKLSLRDSDIYFQSLANTFMDLFADGAVRINSPQLLVSDNLVPDTNNTGSVGEDAIRFADGYFVTMTAKNLVTGKIIETEIAANPGESFEEGDLVQIMDANYFTKTKNKLANVIGVVTLNPGNVQTGTETVTSWVDEERTLTRTVDWIETVTDAYGQNYTVQRSYDEPLTEWYLEIVSDTLANGDTILYYENRTRVKTETIQVEVTREVAIYAPKNEPVLCVFGKALVKISEPVVKNDVLVASQVDGKARPLRTVLSELVEQYGSLEINLENVLTMIEKLGYKTLGRVMEGSDGDTCFAMIGY